MEPELLTLEFHDGFWRAKSEIWQPPSISGSHIKIIFLHSRLPYAPLVADKCGHHIFQISCLNWGVKYSRWGTLFPLLPMLTLWLWVYICLWRALVSSCVMYIPKCTGVKTEKSWDSQLPTKVTDWSKDQGLLRLMTCCNFALRTLLFPWWELLHYFLVDSSEKRGATGKIF